MAPQQHILQVSELTKKVRFILESELNTVWLCGEISNFIAASSGHWYLSLKDNKSQVKCAMFKGSNARVRMQPKNGQQVLVRAKVSLYEPRGDFQLILEQMEDAGEGLLRQQYDALKLALNAQGLFNALHKRPIPKSIRTVGVVTSPTGAAIKDILSVLKRRNPSINVIIYPALVQGALAKNDIRLAIQKADSRQECDVLIVGRGGGSLEDLWSFNEEDVVRAIYACRIPIISAVGHEIDTTLSDYVADLRAPTPSAAAELVSGDKTELIEKLTVIKQRLQFAMSERVKTEKRKLAHNEHQLFKNHPEQKLHIQMQKVDELSSRLMQSGQRAIIHKRPLSQHLTSTLLHLSPLKNIAQQQDKSRLLDQRLHQAVERKQSELKGQFVHLIEQLQLVSPLATIARGYSVTRDAQGNIIKRVEQVKAKDDITIEVTNGKITARVLP